MDDGRARAPGPLPRRFPRGPCAAAASTRCAPGQSPRSSDGHLRAHLRRSARGQHEVERTPAIRQRRRATVGAAGTLIGLLLGAFISLNLEPIRQALQWLTGVDPFPHELYFLSRLPADMDASEISTVVAMALTLSVLATLYPSWRAARLDPVEALRYQ